RLLDERLGALNFWTMFVGFNLAFFPMHLAGILGMPRRVYTYPASAGLDAVNLVSSIGAFVVALSVALFVVNAAASLRRGRLAGRDPWRANTLEWSTASPPEPFDFARLPAVRSRNPLWEPSVPSAREPAALATARRQTAGTSVLEAQPELFLRMPGDSIWPALAAAALLLAFGAILFRFLVLVPFGLALLFALVARWLWPSPETPGAHVGADRKSTRLNSSHVSISY